MSMPLQSQTTFNECAAKLASTFSYKCHIYIRNKDLQNTGAGFGTKTLVHQCLKIYGVKS